MNVMFYLEKLQASDEYKNFVKENSDSFFCSGFFVMDMKGQDNKQHFDLFIPDKKEMFSFQLEGGIKMMKLEKIEDKIPSELKLNTDFDFEKIKKMIESEIVFRKVNKEIQKIMISLQNVKDKDFLICTVFVSGLGMIKISIDLLEMKVIDFEDTSFFDMVNVFKKK